MTRLFIGNKAGTGPVLKVMANDADDPLTTPNNHHGKFRFNSETTKVGYIRRIVEIVPDFTTYPAVGTSLSGMGHYYYPPGSNFDTCSAIITSYNATAEVGTIKVQMWQLFPSFFGLTYQPIVEMRYLPASPGDVFDGPYIDGNTDNIYDRGTYLSSPAYRAETYQGQRTTGGGALREACARTMLMRSGAKCLVTCFNLPDYDVPIPDYSSTPTAGQEAIRINNEMCRVALPGRTVADSDPDHFILHENNVPAKILRSGEITVALGGTETITLPLPATSSTYMDFLAKRTAHAEFWNPPFFNKGQESQSLAFTYTVSGASIVITNTSNFSIDIRYMVCAADESGHSTGGSKVMFTGNDGSQDYIQAKRPGSSDSAPTLNDIMFDTRLSYLPILAEGFLKYPDDFPTVVPSDERFKGERMATVSFDNPDGLLPFAKCGSLFASRDAVDYNWARGNVLSVWGFHSVAAVGSNVGKADGASTWAEISDTSVNFYSAGANPMYLFGGNTFAYTTMRGLRYYIFGIPNGL